MTGLKVKLPSEFFFAAVFIILINSCTVNREFRNVYSDYKSFKSRMDTLSEQPFLKAHLKNGDLALFYGVWDTDSATGNISGSGKYYDYNRKPVDTGLLTVNLSEVALFETNRRLTNNDNNRIAALSVLMAADLGITVFCITNPKACFGSCPTFYLGDTSNLRYADAEGFSSSILPILKASDIDALNNKELKSQEVTLTLKNEALETHVIDKIDLLCVPRNEFEHIYHTPGDNFFASNSIVELDNSVADSDSLLNRLESRDGYEWFSKSDPDDLNKKEEIVLTFNPEENGSGEYGFALSFRQSLMTTYLYYNMMDYLGDLLPSIRANIEMGNISPDIINEMYEALGGIEVFICDNEADTWNFIGSFNEAGPIAINKQLLPFSSNTRGKEIKVKLRMTQGLWRLDNAFLVPDIKPVIPISLDPVWVSRDGNYDFDALQSIKNDGENLVTFPGDKYEIGFELPDKRDYELFLMSEGYYLEWLRPEWMESKDLKKLYLLVNNPQKYLKKEARSYKLYEDQMEEIFWNSKIN